MAENSCYTLRFLHADKMHGAGERVMASSADIHVGQRQDCEVRLENPDATAFTISGTPEIRIRKNAPSSVMRLRIFLI